MNFLSPFHRFSPVIFWHAPRSLPLAIAAGIGLLLAIVWLYPVQLRLVSWPWRIVLPLLRAASVLSLAISLLKPVAVRIAPSSERGTLLVLLDRSRSMSIVDSQRTPAQLVALADALGRLSPGARTTPVALFQGELSRLRLTASEVEAAREDLDFALISGRDVEPRQSRLREVFGNYLSRAKTLAAQGSDLPEDSGIRQKLSELTDASASDGENTWRSVIPGHIAQILSELAQYQERADQRLYESNPRVHQECDEVAKVSRFELATRALLDSRDGLLSRVRGKMPVSLVWVADRATVEEKLGQTDASLAAEEKPTGLASDLTGGIYSAAAGRPVRAVVLVSDGRQVGGDPRHMTGLAPPGVSIFTVGVAPAAPPRDVSITDVRAPVGAFVGDTVNVTAQIRHDGYDSGAVDVKLAISGLAEQVQHVELTRNIPASVVFPVDLKAESAGVRKIEISVSALPGEATEANNHVERYIKVMPERLRVSVWAGCPGWDYQYLRNMLARRSDIQLHDLVLDSRSGRVPMKPQEILRQDVVVLFDTPVSSLDPAQWDALLRLVDERGGSVILVAGDGHLPAEYSNPIPAASLLPFDPSRVRPRFKLWPGEQPAFRFVPDPLASALDVMKLGKDDNNSPRRWEELPPMFEFLQLPPLSEGKFKPRTQVLLTEVDSGSPVLLDRRLGAGRTLFLGLNETWRWRYKVGERDQDRFWRQLIHYGAQPPYFANSASLSLDADQVFAQPQAPVHVRTRFLDERPSNPPQALQVFKDGKLFTREKLSVVGVASAGRGECTLSLPAGKYDLRLSAGTQEVHMPLRVAVSDEMEMENLASDNDLLRRIAESSGGEFFPLEQIGRLPDRLAGTAESRSHFADMRLWDSPYLFLFVVGCFSTEWAVRKRCGLA